MGLGEIWFLSWMEMKLFYFDRWCVMWYKVAIVQFGIINKSLWNEFGSFCIWFLIQPTLFLKSQTVRTMCC